MYLPTKELEISRSMGRLSQQHELWLGKLRTHNLVIALKELERGLEVRKWCSTDSTPRRSTRSRTSPRLRFLRASSSLGPGLGLTSSAQALYLVQWCLKARPEGFTFAELQELSGLPCPSLDRALTLLEKKIGKTLVQRPSRGRPPKPRNNPS
jgi:hypothetical protein